MSEQINSNRRGFLTRLSKPVKAAANYEEKSQRSYARPPRAVDEVLFERLCDGGGLCEQACPNSVICVTSAVKRARLARSIQRSHLISTSSLALLIAVITTCKWTVMRAKLLVQQVRF